MRQDLLISNDYLNLPQTAKKTGVDVAFVYDATGTKLQKQSKIGTAPNVITTTRDYVGGIEYNNGVIDIIHNSMGYAQKNGTNYVYHYNLKDHLGNIRATLKRGSSVTAVDQVQRDNYYPFGKRKVVAGGNNKYLYNGKEIQGELGDQYDYEARFYDAEIGRWNVVDPKAAEYYSTSPYTYVENNPIGYIDPTGMYKVDANGNITIDDKDEIGNFVKFLNSNQGATYKDVATEVFSAGRGYSNELEEIAVTGSRSAFDNGSWLGSAQSRQASGAVLLTTAFSLEGLSGGGALGLGISGSALTATGIGAAFVGLTYIGFKVNEAGYPVDNRPFAQSALGLPSLSETNGFVFSKKSGKEKASDVPSWARGKKPLSGESGKDFAKRLLDEQYGTGNWSGTGPGTEFNKLKKSGDRSR